MKKFSIKLMVGGTVMSMLMGLSSCNKALDVKPEDSLEKANFYQNVYDADAAVLGLYGKFLRLAKQYTILNELRADLLQSTTNADEYLQQISNHTVSVDNPYADPRPFYDVIIAANDILENFEVMKATNKMKEAEFNQRYSDIGAMRSFLYLQLGIHYGTIPYVTDPIENVNALKDQANFPRVTFDVLLDSLISFTEALPFKGEYPAGTSFLTNVDGYNTQKFFINKKCLLGDLYLWKGNYRQASSNYREVMGTSDNMPSGDELYNKYKIFWADVATNNDLSVGYIRYKENDINSLINNNTQGWRSIFARGQDNLFNWEHIWVLPFDKNFLPENPMIELFSNRGGRYLVKPSQDAIDRWNSQVQNNNFPFDARGLFTYRNLGGQNVVMKYLYNYLDPASFAPVNMLEKNGKWFLYRAATLHLRFAEAANRDSRRKLAYALVNNGIRAAFDSDPANTDQTNKQATYDAFPYNFDARNGDYPRFRDYYHKNNGIRGRAYVKALPVTGDSTVAIENMIADEAALELAYEGNRWQDLLRIARRRNDPSFLADRIYFKLKKENSPVADQVRAKLMNKDNWYLPFKWK